MRTKAVFYPLYIILVFLLIEGAGRIDENSAGFQSRPDIHQNLTLPLGTHAHILYAPLRAGSRVLAKHAFARTGSIHQHAVKEVATPFAEVLRRIVGHYCISITPLLDILA